MYKNLSRDIFIAMIAGTLLGVLIKAGTDSGVISGVGKTVTDFIFADLFGTGGKIFVSLLKLLVVPIVLVSLISGVCSLAEGASFGRLAAKTFGLYIGTTMLAITLAILVGLAVDPGDGVNLPTDIEYSGVSAPPLSETFINIFPSNPFASLSTGNMLQIIVFALLIGVAIRMSGERGQRIANMFHDWNEVVMKLVGIVIRVAPFGVFCLLATLFAVKGIGIIGNLAAYFFSVLFVLLLHAVLTYGFLLTVVARLNPIRFIKKMVRPMMFAFSTSSSGATIPVNLENTRDNLGVSNSVASFTIPMGATINMDGTAIMQGLATLFIAGAYAQFELTLVDCLVVVLTATLASIGTAGVPSVGLVLLTLVLNQVGLPVEGIALIIGIDRLLDMSRTVINITGDATISCAVARTEGELNDDIFNDDNAMAPAAAEQSESEPAAERS